MKKSNITIIISIIITILIIVGAMYFTSKTASQENVNNVFMEGEKQVIEIKAKGGYSPEHSFAKAGISTILRINTSGTFDCSSNIRIPSMNISQNLPLVGKTDIDLGIQLVGTIEGTCGMGMYPFDIKFE